jgi:hypothetical protein
MNEYLVIEDITDRVDNGNAFWKLSSGAGVAAARGVMNALCIMRRPQGLPRGDK